MGTGNPKEQQAHGSATANTYIQCYGCVDPASLNPDSRFGKELARVLTESHLPPVTITSLHPLDAFGYVYLAVEYQLFEHGTEVDGSDPEEVEKLIQDVLQRLLCMPIEIRRFHLIIDVYVDF
jgi:hypothetical protein